MKITITTEQLIASIRDCIDNGIPEIVLDENGKAIEDALLKMHAMLLQLEKLEALNAKTIKKMHKETKVLQ